MMNKKTFSIVALGTLLALTSFDYAKAGKSSSLVVVELFTSQGCPACTMSNAIISDISKDEDLLTLSWSVDYWDYMGWKDTLATPENTKRQENYNKTMGKWGVYTPEIIINGERHIIGANPDTVYRSIKSEKEKPGFDLDVSLNEANQKVSLSIGSGKAPEGATIRLVWFSSKHSVKVNMGTNKGKNLKFTNVVIGSKLLGTWDGNPKTLALDLAEIRASGADCIAVLIQHGDPGPILGAAKMILPTVT